MTKTPSAEEMAALFRRKMAEVDDAVVRLQAELARVTEERDALLKYVPRECNTCKYWDHPEGTSWCDAPGEGPCHVGARELWQWRGPQKEE